MQYLQYKIDETIDLPTKLSKYIHKEDMIIFDIETTGLSHKYHKCILIGYITYENNSFFANQIFCDSKTEESQLLNEFINIIKNKSIFITYNGHSFDIPFLNSRLSNSKISYNIIKEQNFDLLRIIRTQSEILNLPNLKLKTIEKHLGIEREDTISGKESIELYKYYERTGDEQAKHKILLHNREDIIYLLKCLFIVDEIDENLVLEYSPIKIPINYATSNSAQHISNNNAGYLSDVKTLGDKLQITIKTNDFLNHDYRHYGNTVNLSYEKDANILILELPIFTIQTQDQILNFIDIDLLNIEDSSFNEFPLEKRMKYLCSDKFGRTEHYKKINIANIASQIISNLLLGD